MARPLADAVQGVGLGSQAVSEIGLYSSCAIVFIGLGLLLGASVMAFGGILGRPAAMLGHGWQKVHKLLTMAA